ncbi:MAG TPA: chemotaxis protein [Nitrospirae bacterium]|nr:chemotaxis protein [Nitrospirota bacterium]
MSEKNRPSIIVKKVKKIHKKGHSGTWKVAYADFVTAMMAFFLLLWILTVVPPSKKEKLAGYLDNYHIFQPAGESLYTTGQLTFEQTGTPKGEGISPEEFKSREDDKKIVVQELKLRLGKLWEHIIVQEVDGKLRINLVDKKGKPMFPPGGFEPNALGKKLIKYTAEVIKNTPNKFVIEGHTDSYPYSKEGMTNWDLSTLRAAAVRREFQAAGIHYVRFVRVVGYADKIPLLKDDPYNSQNRRVSVLMVPVKQEEEPPGRVLH